MTVSGAGEDVAMKESMGLRLHKRAPYPMNRLKELTDRGNSKSKSKGAKGEGSSRSSSGRSQQGYDGPYVPLLPSKDELEAQRQRLLQTHEANREAKYEERCQFIRHLLQGWKARLEAMRDIPGIDRELIVWKQGKRWASGPSAEAKRAHKQNRDTIRLIEDVKQGTQISLQNMPLIPDSIEAMEEEIYTASIKQVQDFLRGDEGQQRQQEGDRNASFGISPVVSSPRHPAREQDQTTIYSAAEAAVRALDRIKLLYRDITIEHAMFERNLAEEELAWQAEQHLRNML